MKAGFSEHWLLTEASFPQVVLLARRVQRHKNIDEIDYANTVRLAVAAVVDKSANNSLRALTQRIKQDG